MAANNQAFAPVLAALETMSKRVPPPEKVAAHKFLETFQKSTEAWTLSHAMLQSDIAVEAKLFAATTLKGKIVYDLDQLPQEQVTGLRDSVLAMLSTDAKAPKPIRTQLCICLASLAIQMTGWKDVLATVSAALGDQGANTFLEFLKILPEEVTEGRKINLSEEELDMRTVELLEGNANHVLNFFNHYSQSSPSAATNPELLECIASWLREIPSTQIVSSPLMDVIMKSFNYEETYDTEALEAGADTLCTLYRDTTEVDSSMDVIQKLYPRVVSLSSKIKPAAEEGDINILSPLTRVFAEAGEAWVVLIARLPADFHQLVEAILECCEVDENRDVLHYTFNFWYELKQYLVKERYEDARRAYAPVYSKLVDIMIKHLQYPRPEDGNDAKLFEDAESEDKFREFRHNIGDVLKDCCEVIGVNECLGKAYTLIQAWVAKYASQSTHEHVPHWQELEAPIFSMRAMGRMVDPEESTMLPQIIPLIVQIPDQDKIRFQAIMALARYTEWTAQHPETLEAQLQYVTSGFQHNSIEVVQAAALAFKYLGTDCRKLLGDHIAHIHGFYESVLDRLKPSSQEEVTEGAAAVISVQPTEKLYDILKLFCDPIMNRIMTLANNATDDEDAQRSLADYVQLISLFVRDISPYIQPGIEHPCVKYCGEILPILNTIVVNYAKSIPILERICRCWRFMVISYRSHFIPLLPALAQSLSAGFEASREGCFLWATDAVLREFSGDLEPIPEDTTVAVYQFFEQQTIHFMRILNDLPPSHLPDMIEDFFRLVDDAVRYYPRRSITSSLAPHIFSASLSALTLEQHEPLIATLHYLHDLLSFGFDKPAVSSFSEDGTPYSNPVEVQAAVKQLMASQGTLLVQRILTGMMFSFPPDCFLDASTVVMMLFELMPQEAATWVEGTVALLPAGTLKAGESERLMKALQEKLVAGDSRRIRVVLQDFTNSYRRRNVAPREGLGRLEATRFRFSY